MDRIIIPRQFSKYGIYTSSFVLLNSLVAYLHGHLTLAFLLICLFFTSIENWLNMYLMSPIKILDIFFACSCILFITFETSQTFTDYFRDLWFDYVIGATLIFTLNTTIFYEELNKSPDYEVADQILIFHVWTHLLVMHIMSTVICMAGIIYSKT